jgi:hypothetical protein
LPTRNTSPPSIVAGALIFRTGLYRPIARSTPAVSLRRDGAPGRVSTATSSRTTTASSTNTESGRSSAGSMRSTVQPSPRSVLS